MNCPLDVEVEVCLNGTTLGEDEVRYVQTKRLMNQDMKHDMTWHAADSLRTWLSLLYH
jgi:hypothetical protein